MESAIRIERRRSRQAAVAHAMLGLGPGAHPTGAIYAAIKAEGLTLSQAMIRQALFGCPLIRQTDKIGTQNGWELTELTELSGANPGPPKPLVLVADPVDADYDDNASEAIYLAIPTLGCPAHPRAGARMLALLTPWDWTYDREQAYADADTGRGQRGPHKLFCLRGDDRVWWLCQSGSVDKWIGVLRFDVLYAADLRDAADARTGAKDRIPREAREGQEELFSVEGDLVSTLGADKLLYVNGGMSIDRSEYGRWDVVLRGVVGTRDAVLQALAASFDLE